MPVELTIAIVNYKTPDLLEKCLKSIYKYVKGVTFAVFVVDNNSVDGSTRMVEKKFPKVKLIINRKNLYASVGFNQILREVKSDYCLVTEPGVELLGNAVGSMLAFLKKHPDAGAVSCKQIGKSGEVDATCCRFPTPIIEFFNSSILASFWKNKKLLDWYNYASWKRNSTRKVDVTSDAFMLLRTRVLSEINFYDERMGLFFMEVDLCLRLKKLGYSVWHLGNVAVKHLRGQSTLKFKPIEMDKFYEADMLYFYKKHFGIFWWIFLWIVYKFNRAFWIVRG